MSKRRINISLSEEISRKVDEMVVKERGKISMICNDAIKLHLGVALDKEHSVRRLKELEEQRSQIEREEQVHKDNLNRFYQIEMEHKKNHVDFEQAKQITRINNKMERFRDLFQSWKNNFEVHEINQFCEEFRDFVGGADLFLKSKGIELRDNEMIVRSPNA